MSPRAAWRLEAAAFGPVHDYAAGKGDWLPTCRLRARPGWRGYTPAAAWPPWGSTTAAGALRLLEAQGFG